MSQVAGKVVWFSHLFKNFPQFVLIHTIKGFGIVNKAVDVFLELSCLFKSKSTYKHMNKISNRIGSDKHHKKGNNKVLSELRGDKDYII